MAQLLASLGYHDVSFIPGSAMEGDNIYKRSERMAWYHGPTLIEALDRVKLSRETKPLRFVVQDIYLVDSDKVIVGRVESGIIQKGDEVIFQPSGVKGRIEKIKVFQGELEKAETGDSIGSSLTASPNGETFAGWWEIPLYLQEIRRRSCSVR